MNIPNAPDLDDIQSFVTLALECAGGVRQLAAIAGVSERTVYAWKNGERYPGRSKLARMADHLEQFASSGYGATGIVPPWKQVGERVQRTYAAPEDDYAPASDEFVYVEKAQARPSAGGGSLQTDNRAEARYAFRLDWVLQRARSSSSLRIMEVAGRSMEQTLHNGDLVLVNEGDKNLMEDRIYVIRVHEEIYVKRFARTPGRYHFRGDNRELAYQDIEIDPRDESLNWEVIGRILWAGKEL